MSKEYQDNYDVVAKNLGIKHRIGKYGISVGRKKYPYGMKGSWWPLIQITPLDGWVFDPKEIVEAFADDPDFKISIKNEQADKPFAPPDQFSDPLSEDKKEGSHD